MSGHERPGPMSREHVGLLDRVSSLMRPVIGRRNRELTQGAEPSGTEEVEEPGRDDLVARLERLEALTEGLQDAVYRQAQRHDEEMQELRRSLQPDELARSLSDDARRRGL